MANCPGRYRLRSGQVYPTLPEMIEPGDTVQSFRVPAARDEVLVVCFADGGGLISFRRSNGALVHTLNTKEGLDRKLSALGIPNPRADSG